MRGSRLSLPRGVVPRARDRIHRTRANTSYGPRIDSSRANPALFFVGQRGREGRFPRNIRARPSSAPHLKRRSRSRNGRLGRSFCPHPFRSATPEAHYRLPRCRENVKRALFGACGGNTEGARTDGGPTCCSFLDRLDDRLPMPQKGRRLPEEIHPRPLIPPRGRIDSRAGRCGAAHHVMAGLVPAIHAFSCEDAKGGDGRHKACHDG